MANQYTSKEFTRENGVGGTDLYHATYLNGMLTQLYNITRVEQIPHTTQTFRRLADGNRGNRFTEKR